MVMFTIQNITVTYLVTAYLAMKRQWLPSNLCRYTFSCFRSTASFFVNAEITVETSNRSSWVRAEAVYPIPSHFLFFQKEICSLRSPQFGHLQVSRVSGRKTCAYCGRALQRFIQAGKYTLLQNICPSVHMSTSFLSASESHFMFKLIAPVAIAHFLIC